MRVDETRLYTDANGANGAINCDHAVFGAARLELQPPRNGMAACRGSDPVGALVAAADAT